MNRATFIEKLTEVQRTVEQLLAQRQSSEADKFVAYLYQSRKQYRLVCERPNRATRPSSAKLSQATKSHRASDSMATSAHGNICCGFTIEAESAQRRQVALTQIQRPRLVSSHRDFASVWKLWTEPRSYALELLLRALFRHTQ
jgi:hypothetical protein